MTMCRDLGFDILALSETHVLLNCVRPTHETLFADAPNLSIKKRYKHVKGYEAME